jgi:hypothetical protein
MRYNRRMRSFRRLVVGLAALLVVSLVPPVSPASAADTYTGLWLDSEFFDMVGMGETQELTPTRMASAPGTATFFTDGFNLYFAGPTGSSLAVGSYEGVSETRGATTGALGIQTSTFSCASIDGRFIVDEVSFDGSGVVQTLAVRFEQHCESDDAALFGALYYNASVGHRTRTLSEQPVEVASFDGNAVSHPLTITNNGPDTLEPTNFSFDADPGLEVTGNSCTAPLAAGESCDVTFTFTPSGPDDFLFGLLSFTDELAPDGPPDPNGVGTGRDIPVFAYVYPPDIGAYRIAGTSRVATSIAASQDLFGGDGAFGVVLSRADAFADALSGAPLAVAMGGPLLLNPTSSLSRAVAEEIDRVLPSGEVVYLLGGTQALGPNVEAALDFLGYDTVRLSGPNRYATAVEVAKEIDQGLGSTGGIFLATGLNYPDALSAGSAAAAVGGVVLLSAGSSPTAATDAYLDDFASTPTYCFGGPACTAYPSATPFVGTSRFDTARLAAEEFFEEPFVVGVASGRGFADALAGAAHVGGAGPLLLTERYTVPQPTADYISARATWIFVAPVYGGSNVVDDLVLDELTDLMLAD